MSVKSPDLNPANLNPANPTFAGLNPPELNDLYLEYPSLEHLSIVYVGSPGRGKVLKDLFGTYDAHLWPTTEVQEALAFYLFYMPDLVMIDDEGSNALSDEVYDHLESVGAAPLLVLATSRLDLWKTRLPDSSLLLPGDSPDAALLLAAAGLTARHRSAFRARPGATAEGL